MYFYIISWNSSENEEKKIKKFVQNNIKIMNILLLKNLK